MSLTVGLTGQTGAGKTTACEVFSKNGFGIVDCDKLSHELLLENGCKALLIAEFSPCILDEDGSINRRKLGQIVFADREKLRRLNEILHPIIINKAVAAIEYLSSSHDIIILDAPTLFESGADRICDIIIAITADQDLLLRRIMNRDCIDEEQARNRLASQYSVAFFNEKADIVLQNNNNSQLFVTELTNLCKKIREGCNGS